jgi:hypothetical protein
LLFDWGIAQPIDISRAPVTRNGQIVGTPAYVAPERLRANAKPDHRADVYSLAVVLYECLAGRKPFESDDDMYLLLAQLNDEPPELPSHLPAGLRAVVAKGLAKWPDDRYQTAPEMAEAAHAALNESLPVPAKHTEPVVANKRRVPVAEAGGTGALVALVLFWFGLVDAPTLAWVLPALAVAGALFVIGVWSGGERPDNAPPRPFDATRDAGTGGVPPSRP